MSLSDMNLTFALSDKTDPEPPVRRVALLAFVVFSAVASLLPFQKPSKIKLGGHQG